MPLYEVLINRKIPTETLIYKSESELKPGQIIEVSLKNKLCLAIVWTKFIDNLDFTVDKVKAIEKIYNFYLTRFQLDFLKKINQQTFNSRNNLLENFLQPWKLLNKKNFQLNQLRIENLKFSKKYPKISFNLEIELLIRIRNIIRSQKSNSGNSNFQILILFPEIKLLEKIYTEILSDNNFSDFMVYKYTSKISKKTKETVTNLFIEKQTKPEIILSTRSGIFLPFCNLQYIVVIDESNSMHIQDKNKVYFDTRDLVYLMSIVYQADLEYLSSLPSLRLYKFYKKEVVDKFLSDDITKAKKPLKIKITKRNKQTTGDDLLSYQIEEIINNYDSSVTFEES